MAIPSETSDPPSVLAVVLARKGDDIGAVLKTIEAQVYGIEDVVVMADSAEALPPDAVPLPKHVRSMAEVLALAGDRVEYLWLLDSRTTARRDALAALVSTAVRVDASVVGSKVLDVANPQQLLSVGGATDVFGFPYTWLARGELDQEQFDVIRDVACVEPASILVRRDLMGGLGGLDPQAPLHRNGSRLVPEGQGGRRPGCRGSDFGGVQQVLRRGPRTHMARAGRTDPGDDQDILVRDFAVEPPGASHRRSP